MAGILVGSARVAITPDMSGFVTDLQAKVKTALAALNTEVPIRFTVDAASVAKAQAALGPLAAGKSVPLKFKVDPASAAAAKAAMGPLAGETVPVKFVVDSAGVASVVAADKVVTGSATAAAAAQKTLADTTTQTGTAARTAAAATNTLSLVASTGAGRWGFLTTRLNLFGGALKAIPFLGTVGGLHLITDAVLTTASVLIPAGIALGAWGAAAAGSIGDVVTQLQNIHTVTVATGQSLAPLTGGFQHLQDAVRPQVFQLFGDALTVIGRKTGLVTTLATGAGTVLDQLGARLTRALDSSAFAVFLANAVTDLAKLGDIVGNLGGVLGNLFKVLPGYGQTLLNLADGFTKVAEAVTGSGVGQAVLKTGLAFHGAFLYLGLGATVAAVAVQRGLGLISGLALKGAVAAEGLGAAGKAASAGLLGLAGGAETAAALPWGWISVAAVGIGILAYKILTAKDATQQWLAAQQQVLLAQPAIRGYTTLLNDQIVVATDLGIAHAQLAHATAQSSAATQQATGKYSSFDPAVSKAAGAVHDLSAGQRVLNDQAALYQDRLGKLAIASGGLGRAQGLLVASGITMKQMLDGSASAWAQILTQVESTIKAYTVMGQTGGVLGADMNALNIAASDQVAAMTKLNTAWDTTIGIVSGGQPAFVTFQQDILSVNEAFQGTGGTTRTVTATFAAASAAAKAAGASMTGLNGPSLQLRSTWQAAFAGGAKLVDALRLMSSASPGGFPPVTKAVKDVIGELLPFGRQSAATRAQLLELAQEVNPNITSFTKLAKWLGNTKNAGKDLNTIVSRMGVNLQNLAADAANMQGTLQKDLTGAFDAAKIKASGAGAAFTTLGADMGNLGAVSAGKFHKDMTDAAERMVKAGNSASDAKTFIAGMTGQVFDAGATARQKAHDFISLYGYFRSIGLNAKTAAGDASTLTGKVLGAGATAQQKHAAFVTLYTDFRIMGENAKTAAANARALTGWLGKVSRNWKATERITASGTWSVSGLGPQLKAGTTGQGRVAARGMLVSGGIPGKDSVPVMAMPGEAIVPRHLTPAIAPFLKANKVPGFASGGIVPSYSGSTAGLQPWAAGNWNATQRAMAASLAAVVGQAIRQAAQSFGAAGPGGGAPAANAALARRMFPNENFAAWNYVAMRESGWNQFARNPSSGAYGIAQALPPTKYPFAGQAAGGSNPAAQISWMEGYMRSRYGGAVGAAAHERAFNWYDGGGLLYPGVTLAVNATGSPEMVLNASQVRDLSGPRSSPGVEAKLDALLAATLAAPGRTGGAVGGALHSAARGAMYQGFYSSRG